LPTPPFPESMVMLAPFKEDSPLTSVISFSHGPDAGPLAHVYSTPIRSVAQKRVCLDPILQHTLSYDARRREEGRPSVLATGNSDGAVPRGGMRGRPTGLPRCPFSLLRASACRKDVGIHARIWGRAVGALCPLADCGLHSSRAPCSCGMRAPGAKMDEWLCSHSALRRLRLLTNSCIAVQVRSFWCPWKSNLPEPAERNDTANGSAMNVRVRNLATGL
jgi:hypothetical protein